MMTLISWVNKKDDTNVIVKYANRLFSRNQHFQLLYR